MLQDIVSVKPLDAHRLHLRFEDGAEGEIDLAELVAFEGVFAPLRDHHVFAQVVVDPDLGTVVWPNGADLDPAVLYSKVTGAPLPGQGPSHNAG